MQFSATSFLFTFCFALFSVMSLVNATPVGLEKRDVYVPPVLYPLSGTVWKVGARHNVTWDTSNPPKQITNKSGQIYLRHGDSTLPAALASGFSILDGRVEIQVPAVSPGSDYRVVLMGDSGNFSKKFKIET